ncbi:BAG_1a_G0016220.mRNA.1.CDS.1 [Saccharomyces cerevisiae]|nr:BAG_1a_G0016220.mRNA.1.CDS.1 [Saccharomyces cerevisiae]CAI7111127.1 BAG_1a_G0016220.mRNA.1.CDS.1 [Saccharomyces cerevisiae]
MHSHHYARHLPQRSIPCAHDYSYINIYISLSGSKYCILYKCTKYMSYITFTLYFTSLFVYIYVNCA